MVQLEDPKIPFALKPRWAQPKALRLSRFRKMVTYPSIFILTCVALYQHFPSVFSGEPASLENLLLASDHRLALLDTGLYSSQETDDLHEIFEVTAPLPDYGIPVYNQTLLNHVFGNLWGVPAEAAYTLPDVEFNKVVINITTTVSGVQYDRLAHLFLHDVPIWRTLTAEPGGKNVILVASKDLSDYISLFKTPGKIVFQLDNLVNSQLTGEFNVTISAAFYNVAEKESKVQALFGSNPAPFTNDTLLSLLRKIYSVLDQPATVTPLFTNADLIPLRYLPNDDISVPVQVSNTTVAASLRLFVSGNAAEEFWYQNVLEDNVHKFEPRGRQLLGKGPVREVHVYIDDILVAIEAPKPVVFTGGLSPALWNPVVGTGAFDLGHIEVTLSPYLPLLWKGANLRAEVVTGLQHAQISFSKAGAFVPGQNWIASGNLFTWQNEAVTHVSGYVNASLPVKTGKAMSFGRFKPDKFNQIVTDSKTVSGLGTLSIGLNGSEPVVFGLEGSHGVKFLNILNQKEFGDDEHLVAVIKNAKTLSVLNSANKSIASWDEKLSNTKVLHLNISEDPEVPYKVSLVQAESFKLKVSGSSLYRTQKIQNGTSYYFLSPEGNHGTGSLDTKIQVWSVIHPELNFNRSVETVDGDIVYDGPKKVNGPIEIASFVESMEIEELEPSDLEELADAVEFF